MMAHSYFPHTLNYLCMTLLLLIRIPFNLASVVPLNTTIEGNELKSELKTCTFSECVSAASEITKYMNTSVSPCDDFYEFSCGNFVKNVPILEGKNKTEKIDLIVKEFKRGFDALITESSPPSDPEHFHYANNFYKSCMNESYIEELKGSPMANISKSVGGWPVLMKDQWNPNGNWTWMEATKKLFKLGFESIPISFIYGIKKMIVRPFKLKIPYASLLDRRSALTQVEGDSDDARLQKERLEFVSYYNYMVDIAVMFGAERDLAKREFENCIRFELDLERIFNGTGKYNFTTFKELPRIYSSEFLNYISSFQEDLFTNGNEAVMIPSPDFFEKLFTLLKETSNQTIANFVMWRAHEYSTRFLSKEFRERRALYYNLKKMNKTSEECMESTKQRLFVSINSHWYQINLKSEKVAEVYKMMQNIKTSFKEFIEEIDWMDNATKAISQYRLDTIRMEIDMPGALANNTIMKEFFQDLHIDSNKYFELNLKLNTFDLIKIFERFRDMVTSSELMTYKIPSSITTRYNYQHVIFLWPLMLHDFVFNVKRPKYTTYGFLGFSLAHEIAHGIFKEAYWTNASKQAYQQKLNCLANQYGNFSSKLTGQKINGTMTLDENIADNIGFNVAVRAYKKLNEEFGPEESLPGLKYTPSQMLLIINAQRWCKNRTPDAERSSLETDVHSPPEVRVIAPRQNSDEFAKYFSCAVGSPMNPEKKCLF